MAVPTIYSRLLKEYAARPEAEQRLFKRSLRGLRLMVSGSAALPRTIFQEWVSREDMPAAAAALPALAHQPSFPFFSPIPPPSPP